MFFSDASLSNVVTDPMLRGVSRNDDGGLDPRPQAGSPALEASSVTPPANGLYAQVTYRGAFADKNWTVDWTFLNAKGVMTTSGGYNPVLYPDVVSSTPEPPRLTVTLVGGNLQLGLPTQAGFSYQLQSKGSLGDADWVNEGDPIAGDGSTKTVALPVGATGNKFYRVRAQ